MSAEPNDIEGQFIKKVVQSVPKEELQWFAIYFEGQKHAAKGELDQAIGEYDKAIKLLPLKVEAWAAKGVALIKSKRIDEGLKCLDESIRLHPSCLDAWENKAYCLINLEKYEEARIAFKETIIILRKILSPLDFKLNIIQFGDQRRDTHEEYMKLYNLKLERALYLNGLASLKIEKYDDAIVSLDEALKMNPGNLDYLMKKATTHYKQVETAEKKGGVSENGIWRSHHLSQAAECINLFIKTDPNDPKVWHLAAGVWELKGEVQLAKQCAQKAMFLEGQPDKQGG